MKLDILLTFSSLSFLKQVTKNLLDFMSDKTDAGELRWDVSTPGVMNWYEFLPLKFCP